MKRLSIVQPDLSKVDRKTMMEYIAHCIHTVFSSKFEVSDRKLFYDHLNMVRRIKDYGDEFFVGDVRVGNKLVQIYLITDSDHDMLGEDVVKVTLVEKDGTATVRHYNDDGAIMYIETEYTPKCTPSESDTSMDDEVPRGGTAIRGRRR